VSRLDREKSRTEISAKFPYHVDVVPPPMGYSRGRKRRSGNSSKAGLARSIFSVRLPKARLSFAIAFYMRRMRRPFANDLIDAFEHKPRA
jgi:hypothetical protein